MPFTSFIHFYLERIYLHIQKGVSLELWGMVKNNFQEAKWSIPHPFYFFFITAILLSCGAMGGDWEDLSIGGT